MSFVTLVKLARDNSVIDKATVETKFSKEIGISYNSYKKYLRSSVQIGLIKVVKGHYVVMGLVGVINALGLDGTIDKHNRFFKGVEYKEVTFNNVYNHLVDGVVLKNYKQQAFKINNRINKYNTAKLILSNSNLATKQTKAIAKQLEKEAAGTGLLRYLKGIVSDNSNCSIVSGKYHVSKLIGMSTTSGSNRLTKLVKDGKITREVIKRVYNTEYSHKVYDYLCGSSSFFIAPSPFLNKFIEFKGSRIGLL